MYLTNAEEQLMKYVWKLEKAFLKDILHEFPEPKPAATTVNTLLKRMIGKGFVNYKQYGNVREYYPIVKKNDYFSTPQKPLRTQRKKSVCSLCPKWFLFF